jgi:transcriptional regulator with XRE-family HTH domain
LHSKRREIMPTEEALAPRQLAELPTAEALRRQLRIALHRARRDAGLTQKEVATSLDWSTSKVVRIESGAVPVAPSDVKVLLALYGESDESRIEELFDLAKEAREAKDWSEYSEVLAPAFKEMISQEPLASVISKYEPSMVPGYFQTESYAYDLLTALGRTGDDRTKRLEVRSKRKTILDTGDGPEIVVVLSEVALLRPVGGREVMQEQIRWLLECDKAPTVSMYLMPLSAGAHRGMGNAFTILQFDNDDYDALYLEDAEKRSTGREDNQTVQRHLDIFSEMRDLADRSGTFEDHARRILSDVYDYDD